MKNIYCPVSRYLILFSILALSCTLLFSGAVSAQQSVTRTDILMLEGKTEQAVISGERKYAILDSTLIKNEEGEPIILAQLPIPCKAKVSYELRQDKQPRVSRILIQETFIDSFEDWSASHQEGEW